MTCAVSNCIEQVKCRGLCKKHYHSHMSKLNYLAKKDSYTLRNKLWRAENKAVLAALSKKHYEENKPAILAKQASRRSDLKNELRAYGREHYIKHKYRYIVKDAKRRAAKIQRVPKWADQEAIKAFYEACPPGYHVDHIIPLQGKNVSGLHVINNLQYLLASDNIRKGNRFECVQGLDVSSEGKRD